LRSPKPSKLSTRPSTAIGVRGWSARATNLTSTLPVTSSAANSQRPEPAPDQQGEPDGSIVAKTSARRAAAMVLFGRGAIQLGDIFPVYQIVDHRFEIVRATIAVVNVVRVLPYIEPKDRMSPVDERVLAV